MRFELGAMKLFLIILLLFIPLFTFRYIHAATPKFNEGDKVRVTTRLSQEPYQSGNQQVISASGIRIYLPRFPEFHYGDRLEITGTAERSEKGTLYLKKSEAKLVEKHGLLPEIKRKMLSLFSKTLPQTESALVTGVTLGSKEGFSSEFYNSLKNAGVLHVVVASGTNITLVTRVLITTLVLFLTRKAAIGVALTGIWLYALLVGLEAPIVRAAVMGSLAFTAQETGRVYFAWWGLFLSAIVMLLVVPTWLTDIGFLLSFAATAGILTFEKPIKNFLTKVITSLRPKPKHSFEVKARIPELQKPTTAAQIKSEPGRTLINDFSTSLAAQAGVTPILFFAFGQFSPWSPVVNGLLLWTVAPIMSLGFLGALLGLLIEPLGQLLILLTYPLAWLFIRVVELF